MKKFGWLLFLALILLCTSALAIDGGDTIDSAVQIECNQRYTDNLISYTTKNYYKFTLPSAGIVTVGFQHEYLDSSGEYWQASIIDIDKNYYSRVPHEGNEVGEKTTAHYGLPAGTYYFEVIAPYSSYHSNTDYQFVINYEQSSVWETEFNDSITTADPISLNTYYNGMIRNYADKDYYKFTLKEDGYINIKFKHPYVESSNVYWNIQILNAEQKEYASLNYIGNYTDESTSIPYGLSAGTYYMRIYSPYTSYSSNVDYSFKVNFTTSNMWETEFNDSIQTADLLRANAPYGGTLWKSGDKDYYCFEAPADGTLIIFFQHDYIDTANTPWKLSVIDAQENKYYTTTYAGNVSKELHSESISLKQGTYYIKVETYSSSYWSNKQYQLMAGWNRPTLGIATSKVTVKDQTYTGKALKPKVTVKHPGGETLQEGVDYTVSYKNNKKIGLATVTVKGKGLYSGTVEATFKILPKGVKISSTTAKKTRLKITWNKGSNITGYEIQYSLNKNFSKAKTIKIKKVKTTSKEIWFLKKGKTYYVRIRTYKIVNKISYPSKWSTVIEQKLK